MSIKIALAGNPNCGKTTLFNILTGSNQYVLNERIARAIAAYYPPKLAASIKFLKNETISDEFHAEWLAKQ